MSQLLAIGANGPDVSRLQKLLNSVANSGVAIDGDFGPQTQKAVVAFQASRHIRVDGIAGPATWSLLEERPIMPVDIEDPKKNGLMIGGEVVPVSGVRVIGSHDAAWAHLGPGDSCPRSALKSRGCPDRPQMWIWHKTIADDRERILPGKGPAGGARRTADWWREDPHYSGTHLVTGHEGEVACLVDLRDVVAWHATVSNFLAVGQETCELLGGGCYEAAYAATIASTYVGCEALGIQFQVPKLGTYHGHPWPRMLDGGKNMVGQFGHRNNTEDRGAADPGDHLFELAAAAGAEVFDFAEGEDLIVWKGRQADLVRLGHKLVVDGVPGFATTEALKLEGYRGGIWALGRANFHA